MNIAMAMGEVDFATAPVEDLYERLAALRAEGKSVVPVRYHGGVAWAIIGYEALNQTFLDEEHLPCAPAYLKHSGPVAGRTIQMMRGEEHRINRLLVSAPFAPKMIREKTEQLLLPLADRLIGGLPPEGPVDLVARYTHRYPFLVISELLGIPIEDEAWLHKKLFMLFRYPWEPEAAVEAKGELDAYLLPIVRARREKPGTDIVSLIAAAETEGHALSDEEILSFLRLLYPAGAETTFHAMGGLLYRVLSDRALYARLMKEPALRGDAVEEALRLDAPVPLLPRFTENAVTIAGVDIPANSWMLYAIGGANHDPRAFSDPDSFRIDRGTARHITFGRGPHVCIGLHLARAELNVSLGRLLDRLENLRLAEPDDVAFAGGIIRGPNALSVVYDRILPA